MTSRLEIVSRNFLNGQVDTHIPRGEELPYLIRFWNSRGGRGTSARRPGNRVLGRPEIVQDEALVNASTGFVTFDTQPSSTPQWNGSWDLGGDYAVDFAFAADSLAGTQTIMAPNDGATYPIRAKIISGVLTVDLHSGDYVLTHTLTGLVNRCRVARQGKTIYLFVNGVLVDSELDADPASTGAWGTPLWYLFQDSGGADRFLGSISWWRVFNTPFMTPVGSEMHYPNPKGAEVEQYVIGRKLTHPTQDTWLDLGTLRYHGVDTTGLITNGPEVGTSAPYQALGKLTSTENQQFEAHVIDGSLYYGGID